MTERGKSMNGNARNRRVMVASSGINVASPIVYMDMFHTCSTFRDFFREEYMVKLLAILVEYVGVALNGIQSGALVNLS